MGKKCSLLDLWAEEVWMIQSFSWEKNLMADVTLGTWRVLEYIHITFSYSHIQGIVYPHMTSLSSCTHPSVVAYFVHGTKKEEEKNWSTFMLLFSISMKARFQLFHAVALFCIYFSGIFFYICIFDSLIVLSLSLTQKLLNYYIF